MAAQSHTLAPRLVQTVALALFAALPAYATAQSVTRSYGPLITSGLGPTGQVLLKIDRTAVLNTSRPVKRVSVGNSDVADVNAVTSTSVLVTGKKPGLTQVIIWDDAEQAQTVDVVVKADLGELQAQLQEIFPDAKILTTTANGAVVLRGRVSSLHVAEQAAELAAPYGARVLNHLEIASGQQVMLKVRFAEVSRSAMSSLGINGAFASGSGSGGVNVGQVNPTSLIPGAGSLVGDTPAAQGLKLLGEQAVNPAVTVYGAAQFGSFFIEAFVNALRQNNLLRILAEPNLTAISGQEASFLAGGEFPIPVPQSGSGGNATITIQFKEFGVKLNFVPIVLGNGQIRLKVAPEVSDLDFTTAVRFNGFVVPGLSKRAINTTIELCDGQSFAIAGLLNNSVAATKDVVPLLGDMPVIGPLFRSVRYQRKETELVVLVTPRLVSPLNPDEVPALPGEIWRHPTEVELFGNQDLGGPVDKRAAAKDQPAPRFFGQRGFTPTTRPTGVAAAPAGR